MNTNRYIRQTLLDKFGKEGQEKLLTSHVVIVGCGGLGSIAAPYLAGAGVGKITLVDGDQPHISNLHRQVFFKTEKTSSTKAEELAKHIHALNPDVSLIVINKMLRKTALSEVMKDVDVVLECTDNILTKYMVNDYCALNHIPMVYGAIHKYDGYVSFFENKDDRSIHLRDVFPTPNTDIPSCSEVGVVGTLAGVIGLMQANEAIKHIAQTGQTLQSQLLTYNILSNDQMKLKLKKTFTESMEQVFATNSYISEYVCASYEITIDDLLQKRSEYRLVSILEDPEHENIDPQVTRSPLSTFNLDHWQPGSVKPVVYYCMSGVRSGKLVNELLSRNPNSQVLSLAGGLKAFKSL